MPSRIIRFMKQILVSFVLSGAACCAVQAASEYERELERLTQERDKALAAAAEPIQRRYKAALEPLLRKATQANDLEMALRIKQALEAASARPSETAPRSKSEFTGPWNFENLTDGHKATLDINADGTFSDGGKPLGRWETKGKQLILLYNNRGGHTDRFDLPVRSGKLEGKNSIGHGLVMERKVE